MKALHSCRAGIVSFSSRIIAAWRALESEQQSAALFVDPLAEALAGGRAMQRARKRVQVRPSTADKEMDRARHQSHAHPSC